MFFRVNEHMRDFPRIHVVKFVGKPLQETLSSWISHQTQQRKWGFAAILVVAFPVPEPLSMGQVFDHGKEPVHAVKDWAGGYSRHRHSPG
jgi:hypothetical protein